MASRDTKRRTGRPDGAPLRGGTGPRILVAGGGTGGHLFPALAIAEALRRLRPSCTVVFAGAERGIETEVVPTYGYKLVTFPVSGLSRTSRLRGLGAALGFVSSLWRAFRWMGAFRPHVVLGTGGYSSAPAAAAALLRRRPLVLQEQNSYPGLVTRVLSRWAREVYVSFEQSLRYLPRPERAVVVGNPVRPDLKARDRLAARRTFGLSADAPVLLVFGGSQGALAINRAVLEALPELLEKTRVEILWATGPRHFESVRREIAARGLPEARVHLLPFIEDMAAAYSACDLALCRAGATTLAELAALGVPSVLVPYPYAAEDHQTHNARAFVEGGAARMIAQKDLNRRTLLATLLPLLEDRGKLDEMARRARSLARPRAAEEIARRILAIAAEVGA